MIHPDRDNADLQLLKKLFSGFFIFRKSSHLVLCLILLPVVIVEFFSVLNANVIYFLYCVVVQDKRIKSTSTASERIMI